MNPKKNASQTKTNQPVASPIIPDSTESAETGTVKPLTGPPKKKARVFKEDPFFYIREDDEAWTRLQLYYDIAQGFPHQQLMYRNAEGKRRNYYFTNDLLKKLVEANSDRDINFVNLGVKVFGISEDKMFQGYRLLQEGVEIVEPFMGPTIRRFHISSRSDLLKLLEYDMPLISEFSPDMQQAFRQFSIGPVLFQFDPSEDPTSESHLLPRIVLKFAGWRGRNSVRHYVGMHERSHLQRLCGLEPEEEKSAMKRVQIGKDVDSSEVSPIESDSPQ